MLELKEQSRDEMIEENIGLVHSCAHRFKGRGIEYDDLFQAGCMGLVKACDAFDFERGVRFSTYAVPVILGEMRRLVRDGGAIKVSSSIKDMSLRVTSSRERYAVEFGRDPTVDELAAYTQLTREEVVEALSVSAPPVSLTVTSEEGEAQVDVPIPSPEEKLSDTLALRQIIGQLEPRDRQLIVLRYFMEKTQTQTAQLLGMTQVQVSRREKKILAALRQKLL